MLIWHIFECWQLSIKSTKEQQFSQMGDWAFTVLCSLLFATLPFWVQIAKTARFLCCSLQPDLTEMFQETIQNIKLWCCFIPVMYSYILRHFWSYQIEPSFPSYYIFLFLPKFQCCGNLWILYIDFVLRSGCSVSQISWLCPTQYPRL